MRRRSGREAGAGGVEDLIGCFMDAALVRRSAVDAFAGARMQMRR